MTLAEIAANIDAKHERCDGYECCGCFNRLLAAVNGEPDPDGEAYRWPIYRYGCAEPPQYGPNTPWDDAMERISARISEAVYRNTETTPGTMSGLCALFSAKGAMQ